MANASVVTPGLSRHFAGDKERVNPRSVMIKLLIYEGDEFTNQQTIKRAVSSRNCDKYGHPLVRDLAVFTTKTPDHLNAPWADRFGHICCPRNGLSGEVGENALNSRSTIYS
jgi:hypothetical protein